MIVECGICLHGPGINVYLLFPRFSRVEIGESARIGPGTSIHKGIFHPTNAGDYSTIGSNVSAGHNSNIEKLFGFPRAPC